MNKTKIFFIIVLTFVLVVSSFPIKSHATVLNNTNITIENVYSSEDYSEFTVNSGLNREKVKYTELGNNTFKVTVEDSKGNIIWEMIDTHESKDISSKYDSNSFNLFRRSNNGDWYINRFNLDLEKNVTAGILAGRVVAKIAKKFPNTTRMFIKTYSDSRYSNLVNKSREHSWSYDFSGLEH